MKWEELKVPEKLEKETLVKIQTHLKEFLHADDFENYFKSFQKKLETLLQQVAAQKGPATLAKMLGQKLPIIQHHLDLKGNQTLSLSLLCHSSEEISINEFLFELIRFHLIPGQTIYPSSSNFLTFTHPQSIGQPLCLAQLTISIQNEGEFDLIESSLPFVIQALEHGLQHPTYAKAILNREIAIPDQKGSLIHFHLTKVMKKSPSSTESLLSEAALFMDLTPEVFRLHRPSKQLARIIWSL